jgi:hypothetical protein
VLALRLGGLALDKGRQVALGLLTKAAGGDRPPFNALTRGSEANKTYWLTALQILLSLFLAVLVTGCATNPDNRLVGKLTYDQAVGQFGQPKSKENFSDGGVRATWVTIAAGLTVTADAQGFVSYSIVDKRDLTWKSYNTLMDLIADGAIPPPPGGHPSMGTIFRSRILTFGVTMVLLKAEEKYDFKYHN